MRLAFALSLLVAAGACHNDPLNNNVVLDGAPPPDLVPPVDQKAPPDLVPPGPSGIGTPCTGGGFMQGSCAMGQMCIPAQFGFTDGYCTQQCGAAACPADAKCVMVQGFSLCFLKCGSDGDCRQPDYQCAPANGVCEPLGAQDGVRPGTNDGGACVTPIVKPGGDGGLFGPNQMISSTAGPFSAECNLAVDPVNKKVVVGWIAVTNNSSLIGVAPSSSDGVAFAAPFDLPINAAVDKNNSQSDPILAVDSKGTFFITWVGFDRSGSSPNPTNMNVYVARSSDGGASFPDLFVATPGGEWKPGGFIDKPWIAASPVDDALYVTWSRATSQMSPPDIRMARSTDHGATWSAPVTISDSSARPMYERNLCQITVGQSGRPVAAWVEIMTEQFGSTANRVFVQRINGDGTRNGGNVQVSKGADSPAFDDPSVATYFDATNGVDDVYVGFISGDKSGAWDVRVAASRDGGATFAKSVKANDDPTCATHFHHQIAVDGKGNLRAAWYDNRYLDGNVFVATSGPVDANNPLLFGKNGFVNDAPFQFTTGRAGKDWLGDYLGLVVAGGEIYATWTDNRANATSRIYFAKGTLP